MLNKPHLRKFKNKLGYLAIKKVFIPILKIKTRLEGLFRSTLKHKNLNSNKNNSNHLLKNLLVANKIY
jgi:hypothetical protein